jgi:hypothetical protein
MFANPKIFCGIHLRNLTYCFGVLVLIYGDDYVVIFGIIDGCLVRTKIVIAVFFLCFNVFIKFIKINAGKWKSSDK